MSCPQPTPQYGQIERATCASSVLACIARVLSDIASRPVPSLRSRIWRTSGHLESQPSIESISADFAPADNSSFQKICDDSSEPGTIRLPDRLAPSRFLHRVYDADEQAFPTRSFPTWARFVGVGIGTWIQLVRTVGYGSTTNDLSYKNSLTYLIGIV